MDSILKGSSWELVRPLLSPDVVAQLRVTTRCWNTVKSYGPFVAFFLTLLRMDRSGEESRDMVTLRKKHMLNGWLAACVTPVPKIPSGHIGEEHDEEILNLEHDLKSSSSIRGISMPNFEVLDARIASALNRIIHNSHSKRRISLEEQKAQKQDRFLRGRQIAYLIYEYFRVTGANDSVENYADQFTISLRNDDIQEFDSKLDGILLSVTKIPPDDNLEVWYKIRIRESDKLKTVLELYDLEIHQKKAGPDYRRLKTMVKKKVSSRF